MISDILGIDKSRIIFDESMPNGVHRKSTDNSNFLKLSHHKYTPFREGIEKTIEWFKANYPSNVRID